MQCRIYNVVTLKSGSEATQGHLKWCNSIDWVWFPISVRKFVSKMNRLRYSTSKNDMTLKSGSEVTEGHQNRHGLIRHLWFPINSIVTMALILYRFRERRRFHSKITKFSHPCILRPRWNLLLELGIGAGVGKTGMMGLPDGWSKKC